MSADLSEEDIINSLTELMTDKPLHWCRSQQMHWHNWNDFYASARQWFSVDREFQQRLEAKAIAQTHELNEPVTNYIICLRTMLDWDEELSESEELPSSEETTNKRKTQVPY